MIHLILGGVRSGKSAYAESLAAACDGPVCYVATATVGDDKEMQRRIDSHRQRRPAEWLVFEEPVYLANALQQVAAVDGVVLVDCLTLWMTNLLLSEDDRLIETQSGALLSVLNALPGQIILVSNEVGLGILPLGELTRRYCDLAGELHQAIAKQADQVTLVVAGLPHPLKGQPQ